jgi:threonine/homoserine/homoserine lactone efflux protein
VLYQLISLLGAAIVLVAFAGLQLGRLDRRDAWFNILNLAGSALLFWVAVHDQRAGFIALEAIWAAFSIPPLARRTRAR